MLLVGNRHEHDITTGAGVSRWKFDVEHADVILGPRDTLNLIKNRK